MAVSKWSVSLHFEETLERMAPSTFELLLGLSRSYFIFYIGTISSRDVHDRESHGHDFKGKKELYYCFVCLGVFHFKKISKLIVLGQMEVGRESQLS